MFNQRDDEWAGSLENRMRFPLAVVREAQRVIAEHTKRPFLLGYRVSPDESGEGALRISDTYVLIDRLIGAGIDYPHASLFDIPNTRPEDSTGEHTTAKLFRTLAFFRGLAEAIDHAVHPGYPVPLR